MYLLKLRSCETAGAGLILVTASSVEIPETDMRLMPLTGGAVIGPYPNSKTGVSGKSKMSMIILFISGRSYYSKVPTGDAEESIRFI